MCYNVVSATRKLIKYAKHRADDPTQIEELEKQLQLWGNEEHKHFRVSGFAHPKLLTFTNDSPYKPQALSWGLIPFWVKDLKQAAILRNQTLNARVETIFEKPAFRKPAKEKRCIVYLDAFYEHHHLKGKTFPFHISMKDGSVMSLAGLWDEWVDKETGELHSTVSIVTTKGNSLMAKIHNNPKADEARMPIILTKQSQDRWLLNSDVEEFIEPFDSNLLIHKSVRKILGKTASPDTEIAEAEFHYEELKDFSAN